MTGDHGSPSIGRIGREGYTVFILVDASTRSELQVVPELGANVIEFSTAQVYGSGEKAGLLPEPMAVIAPVESLSALRRNPTWYGVPILAPFPGRVGGAAFRFRGKEITLRKRDGQGNALHGVASDRPWLVEGSGVDESGAWLRLRLDTRIAPYDRSDWPWAFDLSMRVSLRDGILRQELVARNIDREAMPFGLGLHPYFSSAFLTGRSGDQSRRDSVVVAVDAEYLWDQSGGLPDGTKTRLNEAEKLGFDFRAGVEVGELPVITSPTGARIQNLLVSKDFESKNLEGQAEARCDDLEDAPGISARLVSPVLEADGSGDREASGRLRPAIALRTSESFEALVFFTPPWSSAISLEPHTILPDGFNLEARGVAAGMLVLEPEQEWRGWVEYYVEYAR